MTQPSACRRTQILDRALIPTAAQSTLLQRCHTDHYFCYCQHHELDISTSVSEPTASVRGSLAGLALKPAVASASAVLLLCHSRHTPWPWATPTSACCLARCASSHFRSWAPSGGRLTLTLRTETLLMRAAALSRGEDLLPSSPDIFLTQALPSLLLY